MNRKTFLSSLLALITAPFLGKSKEPKDIIWPSDYDDLPARREFYRSVLNPPKGGVIAGGYSSETNPDFPCKGEFVIRKDNLVWKHRIVDGEWTTSSEFKV